MRLNLGAGSVPEPGYLNVDTVDLPGIDQVWDLDQFPWPWESSTAERIRAFDVFEHIDKPLEFMRECHRVLRPNGLLDIHTCFWQSENAYTDPTHKRYCTEKTFDYWCPETEFGEKYGAAYARGVAFRKMLVQLRGQELVVILERL